MSVKEVAELFKCDERTIQRAVKELFPEIVKNGVETRLNELQVTAIKLKIEKNYSLDTVDELPKTKLNKALLVKQAMEFQQEMIEELEVENKRLSEENQTMLPKAESFDRFLSATNWQPFNVVAHALEIGRNTMLKILRERAVLMDNNIPYQAFVNEGYFKTIEKTIKIGGNEINKPQTFVSAKGIDYIKKILDRVKL